MCIYLSTDLCPVPAEGHLPALGPGGHPDCHQRDHEGGEVCEEVCGVRGDGEAVGEDATHHLGRHEEQAEDGGHDQLVAGSGQNMVIATWTRLDS